MKRRFLLALPFCGLLTLVTLAPPPADAQEKVKVRFGVEVRSLQTGVQANQALAANQVD